MQYQVEQQSDSDAIPAPIVITPSANDTQVGTLDILPAGGSCDSTTKQIGDISSDQSSDAPSDVPSDVVSGYNPPYSSSEMMYFNNYFILFAVAGAVFGIVKFSLHVSFHHKKILFFFRLHPSSWLADLQE